MQDDTAEPSSAVAAIAKHDSCDTAGAAGRRRSNSASLAVMRMKLAGIEEGPRTVTLERPLKCGAHEEITNWQKDRGVCKMLCMLFFVRETTFPDGGSHGMSQDAAEQQGRHSSVLPEKARCIMPSDLPEKAQRYSVPTAE